MAHGISEDVEEDVLDTETISSCFKTLPKAVWDRIFAHLAPSPKDYVSVELTCRQLYRRFFVSKITPFSILDKIIQDQVTWQKNVYLKDQAQASRALYLELSQPAMLSSSQLLMLPSIGTLSIVKLIRALHVLWTIYNYFHLWKRSSVLEHHLGLLSSTLPGPCLYNIILSPDQDAISCQFRLLSMIPRLDLSRIYHHLLNILAPIPNLIPLTSPHLWIESWASSHLIMEFYRSCFSYMHWMHSTATLCMSKNSGDFLEIFYQENLIPILHSWLTASLSLPEKSPALILCLHTLIYSNLKPLYNTSQSIRFFLDKHISPYIDQLQSHEQDLLGHIYNAKISQTTPTPTPSSQLQLWSHYYHLVFKEQRRTDHYNSYFQFVSSLQMLLTEPPSMTPFDYFLLDPAKAAKMDNIHYYNHPPMNLILAHIAISHRSILMDLPDVVLTTLTWILRRVLEWYTSCQSDILNPISSLCYSARKEAIADAFLGYFCFASCMDAFQDVFHKHIAAIQESLPQSSSAIQRLAAHALDQPLDDLFSSGLSVLLDAIVLHFESMVQQTFRSDDPDYKFQDHYPTVKTEEGSLCLFTFDSGHHIDSNIACSFAFSILYHYTSLLKHCFSLLSNSKDVLQVLLNELGTRIFHSICQNIVKATKLSTSGGDRLLNDIKMLRNDWVLAQLSSSTPPPILSHYDALITLIQVYCIPGTETLRLKAFFTDNSTQLLSVWKANELVEFVSCRQDFKTAIAPLFQSKCGIW